MSDTPAADASVRPARTGEESAIARIQVGAWVAALGERLGPRRLDAFDAEAIETGWRKAIAEPPSPGHQVFVALAGDEIVGFAAASPPSDIVALEVSPDRRRRGHGSRLLAACAEHLRSHGGEQMRIWALEKDRVRSEYLRSAGFAESGLRRELDGPGIMIPEQLWHTSLEHD